MKPKAGPGGPVKKQIVTPRTGKDCAMTRKTRKPLHAGLSRRRFMTLAGTAAGLAATSLARPRRALADEEALTIFTWETYHEDPWIAEWTKASGIPVKVVRTGSVDEMFAQVRSGAIQADILYFDSGSFKRYKEAALIAPLDPGRIANAGNVTPGLKWQERNALDGKLWGIPYNWGTQPLMFDESAVGDAGSWGALWDPKYRGKVNMFDDAYITFPMIALYAGAKDPYNLTDAEFEACRQALKALRPQIRTIARGFNDAEAIYAAGDAVIGYCQNISIVFNLQNKGRKFNYSFPKEGTPTWIDNAVLTPRGSARDAAYRFINDNLAPAWQARFITFSFNNGILTAAAAKAAGVDEAILKKTNILDQDAADFWPKMSIFQAPEDIDRRLEIWNDFKAGTL
jgi:spermidine/putrescine transport system substrate-binding protein